MGKNTGIYKALLELKEEEVKNLINEKIKSGIRVEDIIKELQSGLIEVGKKFEKGDYFIPELIFAGAIMKNSMNIIEPLLKNIKVKKRGKIIMGTVYGDVHDIGKDIVILLLEGAGFEVIDLGTDVEPKKFIEAIKESEAKLIGLSALLTMSFSAIEETVQVIEDSGLRDKVSIMVGGAPITKLVADSTGCDYYGKDAYDGLKYAKKIYS